MAHYLVRATPKEDTLPALRERLDAEEVRPMRPFGPTLQDCLERARRDPATGDAVWEEEDHCTPPLAMERAAVLDDHFTDIRVEPVDAGEGWALIEDLPRLWDET